MPSFNAWQVVEQFFPPDSEKFRAMECGTALLKVPSDGFHAWVGRVLVVVFMRSELGAGLSCGVGCGFKAVRCSGSDDFALQFKPGAVLGVWQ